MEVPFLKMHGLGNDYVYLDLIGHPELAALEDFGALSRAISDRHRGVGSDGLILIWPGDAEHDLAMRIFNADGSEGEMCGNGVRCLMRYAAARGYAPQRQRVRTAAGLIEGEVLEDGLVLVDMGVPRLGRNAIGFLGEGEMLDEAYAVHGLRVGLTGVSMGNPHVVSFWPDSEDLGALALSLGPSIESADFAPQRTNVEFVSVLAPDRLRMEVWERGSGCTQACGTGACAALVAAAATARSARSAVVELAGGDLFVDWRENGHVTMRGPASLSFRGRFQWPTREDDIAW
ncbi:MAG: diaminopimelate epimerase [Thermaerobacter sp.]|nr:diaminopimelate epimerase [Thermaerobacter sp.]